MNLLQHSFSHKKDAALGRRVFFLIVFVGLAYASCSATLSNILAQTSPRLAVQVWPYNAPAAAAVAFNGISGSVPLGGRAELRALARKSLLRDPTVVQAVVVLGLDNQLSGHHEDAVHAFQYAARLSSRDLETEFWIIDYATNRGDIRAALDHYDRALRVSRAASDVLYPTLVKAISDRLIREDLTPVLKGAPWRIPFLIYLAQNAEDAGGAAALFARLEASGSKVPRDVKSALVMNMIHRGEMAKAWNLYVKFGGHTARDRSRDPDFADAFEVPFPFDWRIPEGARATAHFERSASGNQFVFDVAPGSGGSILEQMEALPPGSYIISTRSEHLEKQAAMRLYWEVRCSSGPVLARVPLSADYEPTSRIFVANTCPYQILSLVVRVNEAFDDVTGSIDSVVLKSTQ